MAESCESRIEPQGYTKGRKSLDQLNIGFSRRPLLHVVHQHQLFYERFEVFMAASMKMTTFWNVIPSLLVECNMLPLLSGQKCKSGLKRSWLYMGKGSQNQGYGWTLAIRNDINSRGRYICNFAVPLSSLGSLTTLVLIPLYWDTIFCGGLTYLP